jgi:hypothetical protein
MTKESKLLKQALPWLEGILSGEEFEGPGDPLESLEILIDEIKASRKTVRPKAARTTSRSRQAGKN